MQRSVEDFTSSSGKCSQCQGTVIDAGDEFACTSCGATAQKEVMLHRKATMSGLAEYTNRHLGSYMGHDDGGIEEESFVPLDVRGLPKTTMRFRTLKDISDYGLADDRILRFVSDTVERICEKLRIPRAAMAEAMFIAKEMLEVREEEGGEGLTRAGISAFSIVSACRRHGIVSASVDRVIETHKALGYRVSFRTFFRTAMAAPMSVRAEPVRAEDFLRTVIARLSESVDLVAGRPEYQRKLFDIARRILGMTNPTARAGHSPSGLAATAVYAADAFLTEVEGRRRKALRDVDVAQCVGLAEYTVREQYCQIFRPRMRAMTVSLCEQLHIPLPREEEER